MAKGKYHYWLSDEGLTLLEGWAREGLTDEEIAKKKIKINPSTLYDWQKKYPKISESLKKGKEIVDYEVENSLLKRALGYEYTEVVKERRTNKETQESEMVVVRETTKHMPPDTLALIFWLKNRCPDVWRDKPIGNNDDNGVTVVIKGEAKEFAE